MAYRYKINELTDIDNAYVVGLTSSIEINHRFRSLIIIIIPKLNGKKHNNCSK